MIKIEQIFENKGKICEEILRALPGWFQIESYIQNYAKKVEELPFFIAKTNIGNSIGFISLLLHNPFTAEIYVMGIKPEFHRKKIGTQLTQYAEKYLLHKNFKFMTVKTLSDSIKSKEYEKTRKFYFSLGFCPVEEFKNLWDEGNPCLLMIKCIKNADPGSTA